MEKKEGYLMGATYYDIITITICLFVNLCIGYGSPKMAHIWLDKLLVT